MKRVLLFVIMIIVGTALALLLGGCAPKPLRIEGSGIEAPAPIGYIVWCAENPADPLCGVRK